MLGQAPVHRKALLVSEPSSQAASSFPRPLPDGALTIDVSDDGGCHWRTLAAFSGVTRSDSPRDFTGELPGSASNVRLFLNITGNLTPFFGFVAVTRISFSRSSNCASKALSLCPQFGKWVLQHCSSPLGHVPAINKGTAALQMALDSNQSSSDCFPCFCTHTLQNPLEQHGYDGDADGLQHTYSLSGTMLRVSGSTSHPLRSRCQGEGDEKCIEHLFLKLGRVQRFPQG